VLIDADSQTSSASSWRQCNEGREIVFTVLGFHLPVLHTEIPALIQRSDYDYVVVDCPPGGPGQGGSMTRSALLVSDLTIIPVTRSGLDFWASDSMIQLLSEVKVFVPNLETRLLINRKIAHTRLGRQVRGGVEAFGLDIFDTEVSARAAIAESITRGQTIYDFDPDGPAAAEYDHLIEEILKCQTPKIRFTKGSRTAQV
jgi:chromosome partitioning protein